MKTRRRRSNPPCPLSNPNIDIVPENNHLVGVCLCQFCKCGKHICTKNRHHTSKFLSDSFDTSYSLQFKRMNFDVPYIVHPVPYNPNQQKMDFTTTNSIHYKPYPNEKVERSQQNSRIRNSKFLLSTTAYSHHYPNWGKQEVNFEKGWHAPVRSVEIPFRGETTYSKQFVKRDLQKAKNVDTNKFEACKSHFSISPKGEFNPRTTYNEKMKDYSKTDLNTHVKIETPKLYFPPSTPSQYVTSTDRFYKPATASYIDPRKLRLRLMSRSSIS